MDVPEYFVQQISCIEPTNIFEAGMIPLD